MPGMIEKAVFTAVEVLEARVGLFECQQRSRKPFSPQWRSCEARAGLLKWQERTRKQFSPLSRFGEAREGQLSDKKARESSFHHCAGPVKPVPACFSGRNLSRAQLSPLWRYCEARAGLFNCQE